MPRNFYEQRILPPEDVGALALSNEINHVYGQTATLLTRPAGGRHLVMRCEADGFRIRLGDQTATLTGAAPGADVEDGTGSLLLAAGEDLVIPAPTLITVCGSAATAILTYFWV